MKKYIILQVLLSVSLLADISLTPEEEKNWQVTTLAGQEVTYVPIGEYITSVSTPPKLLHTLSVPYAAQVVQLKKVSFDKVTKGEILATLTATQWIEAQKQAIANIIELMHHEHIAHRKSKLCAEDIIAQKECDDANAELTADRVKLSASKTLLKAYGASEAMVKTLYKDLVILPNIQLRSPINGVLLQVNIQPGKSISPSSALFVIKTDGENWLESNLPQSLAKTLTLTEQLIITIDGQEIPSKLLNISPVLDPLSQTRHARFSLPKKTNLLAGLRSKARFSIKKKAFLVNKKAVVQDGERTIVFIKKGQVYKALQVNVISEDKNSAYLEYNAQLNEPIVISTTSIFQNMLQEGE